MKNSAYVASTILLLTTAAVLGSTNYTVTTFLDEEDGSLGLGIGDSLREVIAAAAGGDTISFDASLSGSLIVLTKYDLVLDKSLNIDASALAEPIRLIPSSSFPSRHFNIENNATVVLNSLILSGGSSTNQGGSIQIANDCSVSLTNCTLSNNAAEMEGGAIYNDASELYLTDCILLNNQSENSDGGAIYSSGLVNTVRLTRTECSLNESALQGGAVHNDGGAVLDLIDCTIDGNQALQGAGIYNEGAWLRCNRSTISGNLSKQLGGGIYLSGSTQFNLRNSTLAGNEALEGGGLYFDSGISAVIRSSTISENLAHLRGGGVFTENSTVTLRNAAVAANEARSGTDLYRDGGTITLFAGSSNMVGNNDTVAAELPVGSPNGNGDFAGTAASPLDPKLSSLGWYGGSLPTMAPLQGSPLIDNAGPTGLAVDQRGFSRTVGAGPDIGAVERTGMLIVDTLTDEDDGALGTGSDSLREVLSYGVGTNVWVTFDQSLDGGSIQLDAPLEISGATALIDASGLSSGITLTDAATNRLMEITSGATVSLHSVELANGSGDRTGGAITCIDSDLTLDACLIRDNHAIGSFDSFVQGGALLVSGESDLVVSGCTFSHNLASNATVNVQGGAIWLGPGSSAVLVDSIFNTNLVLFGGTCQGGAVAVNDGAELSVNNCLFLGNQAAGGSTVGRGGAIYNDGESLLLRNSALTDNLAIGTGIATAGHGGGLYNSGPSAHLIGCTLNDNQASASSGPNYGGGIYQTGISHMHIENSTLYGNSAAFGGGGIQFNASATLRFSTVSGNVINDVSGGSGIQIGGGTVFQVNLDHSIIAGNGAVQLPTDGSDIDYDNTNAFLQALGPNLIGDNTTVTNLFPQGALAGTAASPLDPLLGSLADNGGETETRMLLASSPAIDAGVTSGMEPFCDQRGFDRIRGTAPDLGSYESGNDAGYDAWALENIADPADRDFDDDLEPDNVFNGWEYALRQDPYTDMPFDLTLTNLASGEITFTIPVRVTASDLVYIVETSTNLVEGAGFNETLRLNMATLDESLSDPNAEAELDTVNQTLTYLFSTPVSPSNLFWRLRLERIVSP